MRLLDNRILLFSVVTFLVLIKFMFIPWSTWQSESVNKINKTQMQISKGLMLVQQEEELENNLNELLLSNQNNLNLIASLEQTSLAYQLNIQKELENLMKSFELSTRSVSWLTPIQRDGLEEHRMEVSLSGDIKNFVQFILAIEKLKPKLTISEFRSNISKMQPARNKLGNFVGKIVITGWRQSAEYKDEE